MNDIDIGTLKGIANQLRIHSIEATTAAGSGHPTSCCSAADVVAANAFTTTTLATTDILDPVVSFFTGAACEKASIGCPCDAQIEKLRDDFARTTDLARRKELAEALQVRLSEFPTYAPLGQFNMPVALRSNVSGNMEAPATVFWNVKKVP